MELSLRTLRFRLQAAGLLPRTRLARAACYLLGLDLLLFALQKFFGLFKVSWGQALSGWVGILSFLAIILFSLLAYPLAQSQTAVAAAQPADRDLHVHRRDPGGPADGHGVHHYLFVCRTVRELRGDVRTEFPAAQPAIGERRHRQ